MSFTNSPSATGRLVEIIKNGKTSSPHQQNTLATRCNFFTSLLQPAGNRRTVGVEWRDKRLYLTESKHLDGRPPILQAVNVTPIPPGLRPGDDAFSVFLRKELGDFCGNAPDVDIWALLPDDQADHWHFRIPKVPLKERDDVAFWTAKKERDFDERLSVFDCTIGEEIIEQGIPKLPVTATIANRAAIAELRSIIHRAGYELKGLTTRTLATQNIFASGWTPPDCEQFAIILVDDDATRIDIYAHTEIVLSRVVKTGFNSFVRSYMESFSGEGAQPDAAPISSELEGRDALLRQMEACTTTPEDLGARLGPAVERLVRQLERTVDHFTNTLGYPAISHLFIATPGGCHKIINDQFASQLGVNCSGLHYLRGTMSPGAQLDLAKLPPARQEVAWAIGLSLADERRTQNCLNTFRERRAQQKRLQNCRYLAIASAVVVALVALFTSYEGTRLAAVKSTQAALQNQLRAYGEVMDEQKMLVASTQVKALRKTVRTLSERQVSAALVSELSAITPEAVRLSGLRLTHVPTAAANAPAQPKKDPKQGEADAGTALAIITGTISGDMLHREATLADFLSRLERSPLVLSVSVEKKGAEGAPGIETLQFVATLKLV